MTDLSDLPVIPEADQQRIDDEVAAYRRKLEFIYRMAYLQGGIDTGNEAVHKMRAA